MKKYLVKFLPFMAMAMMVLSANSTCLLLEHQSELPNGAQKFRKF